MEAVRFFAVTPDAYSNRHTTLMPDDGDYLALTTLRNSVEIYRDDDKVIVSAKLNSKTLTDLSDISDITDPLSIEAVEGVGISLLYCGEEYSTEAIKGLFWYYPALEGTEVVGQDEEGNDVEQDIVTRITWAEG